MNKKEIAFGIGIALAVLAVFTTSAAAQNIMSFDPDPSCAAPGETITVTLWANTSDGTAAFQNDVYFDRAVVNITNVEAGDFYLMFGWHDWGDFVRAGGWSSDGLNYPPGNYVLAKYTLVANNSGTSPLDLQGTSIANQYGNEVPNQVWNDGTFCCPCPCKYTISGYTDPAADTVNITNLDKPDAVVK